ncbi:MAG: hypothetical protein ACTSVY_14945 [Candidatus Helarchaeota archaeon]
MHKIYESNLYEVTSKITSQSYVPGTEATIIDTDYGFIFGTIAMTICSAALIFALIIAYKLKEK